MISWVFTLFVIFTKGMLGFCLVIWIPLSLHGDHINRFRLVDLQVTLNVPALGMDYFRLDKNHGAEDLASSPLLCVVYKHTC